MIPLSIIKDAFPNQPRMQQAFAALVQQAEDLVASLTDTANKLAANQGDTAAALAGLDGKQPLNSILTELGALPTDPGVPEQVQPGSWQIRPIDAADTRSLLSRQEADTRYLGGAHAAASATKLATARNIAMTGDVTYSVSFDGSANVSAAGALATVNASPGAFGSASQSLTATVDAKGRVIALSAQTIQAPWASITGKPTTLAGYGITDAQPLDGDLTSLAAASGTNTIYYRSAANAWSPVTIGTGLSFSGGALAASGSSITPAALTKTDDTNVTLTLGGTPSTALLQGVSLTLGWTGILGASRGGTGNGFTAFTGPASSTKTFTLPDASDTIGCLGQAQNWTATQTFKAATYQAKFYDTGSPNFAKTRWGNDTTYYGEYGYDWGLGAFVWYMYGSGSTITFNVDYLGNFFGGNDGTQKCGLSTHRWDTVFAVTGTINTSDEREKQDIEPIPEKWLDAWGEVEFCRYRWKDAVAKKGAQARWHVGLIAQRVHAAFARHGLDAFNIGLCCYDEWKAATASGNGPRVPGAPEKAGNRWGLRYEECLALEAAWQRREIARLGGKSSKAPVLARR